MSADLDLEAAALEAQRDQAWATHVDHLRARAAVLDGLPFARQVIEEAFNAGFVAGAKLIVDRWTRNLEDEARGGGP